MVEVFGAGGRRGARRLAARHHRCMRQLSSKEFDFTVDRTGLGKVGYESSPSAVQAPETPLGLELGSQILARGPLSVYEYTAVRV